MFSSWSFWSDTTNEKTTEEKKDDIETNTEEEINLGIEEKNKEKDKEI